MSGTDANKMSSEKILVVLLLIFVIFIVMRNEQQPKCGRYVKRQGMESHKVSNSGQGVSSTAFKEREAELVDAAYGDYNQKIQAMALEPEVFQSQVHYNEGMNRFSSGASSQTERSDPNDINTRIGLRPIYYNVDVPDGARVVPSQSEDQFDREKSSLLRF